MLAAFAAAVSAGLFSLALAADAAGCAACGEGGCMSLP
jgi:hypothetical protein